MTRRLLACAVLVACGKSNAPPPSTTTASAAPVVAAPGSNACPSTGKWAECSLRYRLERSGVAVSIDSGATPEEKELTGTPLVFKVGRASKLELYVYPDSMTRITDAKKLDRTQFVNATAPQTIKRERTLIESANVIGLLTSLDERLRERISDNITVGPPQPTGSEPVVGQPIAGQSIKAPSSKAQPAKGSSR